MLLQDAYRRLLQAAGELRVNTIPSNHPMFLQCQQALNTNITTMQTRGWWFNKYTTSFTTDATGNAPLPANMLSFDARIGYGYDKVILKGTSLINQRTRQPVISQVVRATIIEKWDFQDLPESAAEFITADACLSLAESFDADATKLQTLTTRKQEAYVSLHAEHVRQSAVNMLETPSMHNKLYRANQLGRYHNG